MEARMTNYENASLIKLKRLPAHNKKAGSLPLVLIHGWASSSKVWQPLVEKLNLKRDLWLIDLPACGDNEFFDDFGEEDLLTELARSLPDQCILLGWSLGGMLATKLAVDYPDKVHALITLAANRYFVENSRWPWAMKESTFQTFYKHFLHNPESAFKRFIALQALGDANKKALMRSFEQLSLSPIKKQNGNWTRLLNILSTLDNSESTGKLSCPGLHFFAANDALVPSEAASHIYSNSPGQNVEVLSDCGHALHLSRPEVIARKINNFIEKDENRTHESTGKRRIAKAFSKAALSYDAVANLQREVAGKLAGMEMSLGANVAEKTLLDLGAGTGFVSDFLLEKKPGYTFVLADLSLAMCKYAQEKLRRKYTANAERVALINADMDALPLVAESVDCVISSMSFQWSANTQALLTQLWSCLKPGGRLLFSTVGEDTLKELSLAWQEVDDYVHVNTFLSSSALLALAGQQQFKCEQMQSELHEQEFDSVIELMKNLKTIGAHTVNTGHNHGLTSRARLQALETAYEKFRTKENKLPATWEIHYFVFRKEAI